ncbi:MAG: metallophosphoesterase [Deltaproteobacteria bacterium]|nr:metallophosphoesterase [Deltaproteobacteria bacterium]
MLICAGGDIHGAIGRFYEGVLAFEVALGRRFDWVLHVGDFGVWPDPTHIDRATRNHEGAGDFPAWFAENRPVPRPTVFIKGNHDDFEWLEGHRHGEVLPGLTYLPNGSVLDLCVDREAIRVGGLGGCYGPSDYNRPARRLQGHARRHYTQDEVEQLCAQGGIDVILLHDVPAGVEIVKSYCGGGERRYTSQAAGLGDVVSRVRPRICFFGHHHARVGVEVEAGGHGPVVLAPYELI